VYKLLPIEKIKELEDEKVLAIGICIEKDENSFKIDDGSDIIECFPPKGKFDIGDYVLVSGKVKNNRIYVDGSGKITKELYEFLLSKIQRSKEEYDEDELRKKILEYIDINDGASLDELINAFGPKAKKIIEELLYTGEIYEAEKDYYKKI